MNISQPASGSKIPTSLGRPAAAVPWPVVWWGMVTAVAMLAFFVHLLELQIRRGDAVRAAWQQQSEVVSRSDATLIAGHGLSRPRSPSRAVARRGAGELVADAAGGAGP